MAIVQLLCTPVILGLLLEVVYTGAQLRPPATRTPLGDINEFDIKLVNGSAPNEGRVLIRWLPDSPWTAVCYDPNFSHAIPFQMCRRLGYPFACGQDYAGTHRTDDVSLGGVSSQLFLAACSVDQSDRTAGGCTLVPFPSLDPSLGPPCTHDQDMWLSCGYAGMQDFELRLVEGSSYQAPSGLLQGRCGGDYEWSAICGNRYLSLKQGRVACRELGYSDYAMMTNSNSYLSSNDLDAQHQPNYTLFVDIGCFGNETSLTACQHYSLRECEYYIALECYTGITEYEETTYLCGSKQLCSDQCQQMHPSARTDDIFHYCQCDDICSLFDDCCYDYAAMCSPGMPRLEQGGFTTDQFGCVWVPGSQFTHIGYVAVSRCPLSWIDEVTRGLCERPVDIVDVIESLPVYDERGVDFKNIYCALCNGVSLGRLNRWDVSVSYYERTDSVELSYPSLNVTSRNQGWVIAPPQDHIVIRECPAHLIDTCLNEFHGTQTEEACRAYYAPIKVVDTDQRYRNPHCAICNGKTVQPANSCMDQSCSVFCAPDPWGPCQGVCGPYDRFLTIEVLFDFTSSSSITGVSCSEGQIYDPFLETCRVLTCASGYNIKHDKCVVAPSISPPTNSSKAHVAECLSKHSGLTSSMRNVLKTSQILSTIDPNNTTLSVYVLVNSAWEASDVEIAFSDAIKSIANNSLQNISLPCNISDFSILLPFSFNGSSTCNNFIVDGSEVLPGYNGTLLTVVRFQNTLEDQQHSKTKVSPLCLKINDLNCSSLLTLENNEYSVLSEKNIKVVATGTSLSDAEYVLFSDGIVVVCSFIGPVPEGLEPQIRRAISFAGSILSLLALAATFVTYCVFPELRNVAGLSTMNLAVALFTAIFMFLLSGSLVQNQAACEFGAVVAHFAWLAAFFWMTILSFVVAYALISMLPRSGRSTGISRTLVIYMCLAWGIPLVVVSICLILQYCDCTNLPAIYGEGGICWISDITARIVAFVVPMAVTLVLNVCFYIFAVVSLRRTRQGTSVVRNQGKLEGAKEELTIYAKLCALVGVTWVFGFISQSVTGIIFLSYIYIILNYLQGVFIFIGFCLNKRVRGLWRDKMRKLREQPRRKEGTSDPKRSAKDFALITSTVHDHTEDTKI